MLSWIMSSVMISSQLGLCSSGSVMVFGGGVLARLREFTFSRPFSPLRMNFDSIRPLMAALTGVMLTSYFAAIDARVSRSGIWSPWQIFSFKSFSM